MGKCNGNCFGNILYSYAGKGIITHSDAHQFDCSFKVQQFSTGKVLLRIHVPNPTIFPLSIIAFSGIEVCGSSVSVEGKFREIPNLSKISSSSFGMRGAYYVDHLSVNHRSSSSELRIFKFGLTNLSFGESSCKGGLSHEEMLDLAGGKISKVHLKRVNEYDDRIAWLKVLRGVHVTTELVSPPISLEILPHLKQTVADLCYIMSIASGTKIQWVYCIEMTPSQRKIAAHHCSRITKPFSPLAPIDLEQPGVLKKFIEQVYPVYVKKRSAFELEQGTIDAYLDAKIETDYIQMRGVKMAVAIEALKQTFLNISENKDYELVLSEDTYNRCIEDIQKTIYCVMEGHGIERRKAGAVASSGNIKGLNRRSFRYILLKLCKSINLDLKHDTDLFIASRNSLVHQGRFYTKSASLKDREKLMPPVTAKDEYFFLVNVMDRLYLKLIGYSGPYINWHKPGHEMNDTL